MTSVNIHPTAIVDPKAYLDEGVQVGPYCIVGPKVRLGKNVRLHAHVVIDNANCTIGEGCELFPFVSINKNQDLKYKGEDSTVVIGRHTVIREYATIQPGTAGDKMTTTVGDNCLLMVSTHVAHDCIVGNHVLMANHATLAGHVTIQDYVIIGGLSAIHQFVTIGAHAIIGGMSGVEHDVIPFGNVKGERAFLNGMNLVGMKRRGFSREQITQLRSAYDVLFALEGTIAERIKALKDEGFDDQGVHNLIDFVTRSESRSLLMPK
jgi:UDP-N-acetylglucosamine acyltransferase